MTFPDKQTLTDQDEQALEVADQAVAQAELSRSDHMRAQQALQYLERRLSELIAQTETMKDNEDTDA